MTSVRTVAAHQVVSAIFPRPEREEDHWARAEGAGIDTALSAFSHEARSGRRPSVSSMAERGLQRFREVAEEAGEAPDAARREALRPRFESVLRAFRRGPLAELPRPRSRLIVVGGRWGIYAQPDYWDGRARFYEMKSYRTSPDRPEIGLQLRLFQLAFPGFVATLICYDRRTEPVEVTSIELAPLTEGERRETLRQAVEVAERLGVEKVLEYVDAPMIPYAADPAWATGSAADPPPSEEGPPPADSGDGSRPA